MKCELVKSFTFDLYNFFNLDIYRKNRNVRNYKILYNCHTIWASLPIFRELKVKLEKFMPWQAYNLKHNKEQYRQT